MNKIGDFVSGIFQFLCEIKDFVLVPRDSWYQNKVFDFTQEPHNTNRAVTNLKPLHELLSPLPGIPQGHFRHNVVLFRPVRTPCIQTHLTCDLTLTLGSFEEWLQNHDFSLHFVSTHHDVGDSGHS